MTWRSSNVLAVSGSEDFSYYLHDGPGAFRFAVAGRISEAGARELEQAWRTASSVIGSRSLIVDLNRVTGIEAAGQRLIRCWHKLGAQLVGTTERARKLIEMVTGEPAYLRDGR